MFRRLLCATALLTVVPMLSPAVASADDALPAPPTALSWGDSAAHQYRFNWQPSPSGDVTGYQFEESSDSQRSWVDIPGAFTTSTTYLFPELPAGHVFYFRVVARNSTGSSDPTNALMVDVPGQTSQRIFVRTADGAPVTGGIVSWSADGEHGSGRPLGRDGSVVLPAVPADPAAFFGVIDGHMPGDQTIAKGWSTTFGGGDQVLIVPPPPPMIVQRVTVLLPGGVPAVGVEVNADKYHALNSFIETDHGTYADGNQYNAVITDRTGSVTLRGWSNEGEQWTPAPLYPYPQQAIDVWYMDGDLFTENVRFLQGDQTTVTIPAMKYTTTSDPTPVAMGNTASVRFKVHPAQSAKAAHSTGKSVAGVHVSLNPPSGWKASACSKKSSLSGVTDASGYVTLRVCATDLATFTVSTKGALPTADVTVRTRYAAPGAPSSVRASSPHKGTLRISWAKPAYNGGAPVQSYKITLSSRGHRSVTATVSARTTSHTFAHLARSVTWTAAVSAANVHGVSHAGTARHKTS